MTLYNSCPCPNDPCNVVSGKADAEWVCSQLTKKTDRKWFWGLFIFSVGILFIFISHGKSLESKIDRLAIKVNSVDRMVDELNHNYVTEKDLLKGIREIFDERLGKK